MAYFIGILILLAVIAASVYGSTLLYKDMQRTDKAGKFARILGAGLFGFAIFDGVAAALKFAAEHFV